jgi:hypothetical protein
VLPPKCWYPTTLLHEDLDLNLHRRESLKSCMYNYISPSNIKVIISRKMRWVGHVARMKKIRNTYAISVGKPEGN